jgi:alkanesulfonate monooxygenase SsuD/methylene tetrahydromethanopterin reductase-like flavin-dependent oxidoreductase (luciferase family)
VARDRQSSSAVRRSARFGTYEYAGAAGAVVFGSDDQVLEGIKAFEEAGADQILFAGAVREGTEQFERVAALLGL